MQMCGLDYSIYVLFFFLLQKWPLVVQMYRTTTFRVWGYRCTGCPPVFPSTLPSYIINNSSNKYWPIWRRLSSSKWALRCVIFYRIMLV